jgi:4-amino-4-deoxychorismate lyase
MNQQAAEMVANAGSTPNEPDGHEINTIGTTPITQPPDATHDPFIYASIRYDRNLINRPENTRASFNTPSPYYLLEHQWTRLQVANWCSSFYRSAENQVPSPYSRPCALLEGLNEAVKQWFQDNQGANPETLRVIVRSYISGRFTINVYPPRIWRRDGELFPSTLGTPSALPDTDWTVTLDSEPTEPSESTMYKTSDRIPYARSRVSASIPDLAAHKEVLLHNSNGEILDGSLSTPYFYRNGRWVVPQSSSGGLQGVSRRWALENRLVEEQVVSKESMQVGEVVWLSNGMRGFYYAKFVARDSPGVVATLEQCQNVATDMRSY